MPRRYSPPSPVVEITAENRAARLEDARRWQPTRSDVDVARWRRYLARHWDGTDLDDEDALLVGTPAGITLAAAIPVLRTYCTAILDALDGVTLPDGTLVRRAFAREEARPPTRFTEKLSSLGLRQPEDPPFAIQVVDEVDVIARKVDHVRTIIGRYLLARLARTGPAFGNARGAAADRLRQLLTARHPQHLVPSWKIVAVFMCRIGSWNVDPHDERSVKGLTADWSRWRRSHARRSPKRKKK